MCYNVKRMCIKSSPTERGAPNGVGLLCETEEHGFRQKDKETYYLMTWALETW